MRLVEVQQTECQHLHAWNYDPDKVVRGRPVEPLTNGQMKCMDCGEFFVQTLPPRRYTLRQIEELAREYVVRVAEPDSLVDWRMSDFITWLAKREREEVGGGEK